MAKNKKNKSFLPIFLLVVLPIAAIAISGVAVFRGVENYITTSSYFKIRSLKTEGIADVRYVDMIKEEVLGTNIFELDAKKLSERIKRKFPTFYSVTVTRFLPSELRIVAHERIPVALIRRDLYYLFDAEGVVLSSFYQDSLVSYPFLIGLENKLPRVKVGMAYDLEPLRLSLRLALALRTLAPSLKVTKIDCQDPGNLSFYLENDVLVRIGNKNLESRVRLLPAIIKSIGPELTGVRYIDLRPKEPVIANRNKKR